MSDESKLATRFSADLQSIWVEAKYAREKLDDELQGKWDARTVKEMRRHIQSIAENFAFVEQYIELWAKYYGVEEGEE